jgi:high-affinity iron transporter
MGAAKIMRWLIRILAVWCLLVPLYGAGQEVGTPGAQTVVHLLDYIGVDYSEAVQDGKVRNADEFKEMVEFTGQVVSLLKSLPPAQQQAALLAAAETLEHGVKAKAAPAAIAAEAARLRWAVIGAYKVQIAPKVAPDLVAGAKLYQSLCSGCHGTTGKGDGPAGAKLDPAPSNFHDAERMDQRSAYGLYNAISLGVTGTAMVGFKHISDEQRWALAFHVANLRSESARKSGEVLWQAGKARDAFPDLVNVATLSTNELKERFGADAASVHAYLLAQPQALLAGKPGPVALALSKVDAAVAAYGRGDRAAALQLAVTAYVEGYELIERSLANVDEKLMREGEREMMALRNLIRAGAPLADVEGQAHRVAAVLDRARERLDAGALSPEAIFTSALVILLREGLEALLVVAAILAFLIKANRRDALWWVHAGWIGAILLGLVTWLAASYVIDISGTNREITEGVTGLVAAVMLIYVGYWLHNRSTARAWQDFIQESVDTALASRTLWTMAGVSFLAVYREMFETVLFYQALWVQAGESGRGALGGGIAAAVAALATIGWGIFRYSLRLPLGPFFTAMSWLMCALAVVLAGKGIAALQEAGVVGATVLDVPSVPLLGIFPTLQTLAAQAAVLAIIALGFYLAGRDRRAESMEKRTA